jgi:peptide deformylase
VIKKKAFSLRYYGDPVLRQKADPIKAVTPEIQEIVASMFDCMYREAGVGLAAQQVGLTQRVFVIDVGDNHGERIKRAFINPVIVEKEGGSVGEEGCLSIPGIRANVKRAARIVVEALDETGATLRLPADGILARVIQHENDHLDGILFVDRLSAIHRKLLEGRLKRFRPPSEGDKESPQTTPSL